MLKDFDSIATIAVKDTATAKQFYEDILGLVPFASGQHEVLTYKTGNSKLLVYRSQYAGTNQATVCNWAVDDVVAEVKGLEAKGVKFERYDIPGVTHEGGVHVFGGDFKTAWFKDPDGNILSIVKRSAT